MPRRFHSADPGFAAAFAAFLAQARGAEADVEATARALLDDVRTRGLAAVAEATQRFDGIDIGADAGRVSPDALAAATGACDPDDLAALKLAAARIRAYHLRQLPKDHSFTDEAGVTLGWRWRPLASAGLYAPGGRASYPSSVLMNAIPAKVAGVARLVLTAPTPGGRANPLVFAAAQLAGVDEVYTIGGAQAIGALAFGAGPIRPVDTIVGPGNAYVAAAKRLVFGRVGIDTVAGPSEVLIVADRSAPPAWIAADLLAQAEHDPAAQSVLITDDAAFADAVEVALADHLSGLATRETAAASWADHGAIVIAEDLAAEAPDLIDAMAPEHLQLACAGADAIAAQVRHAGSIFLGALSAEALGDYVTGANHVLPTSRAARFASGLSVYDFLKRSSIQSVTAAGLQAVGPAAVRLARSEGLPAHALSVALRLEREGEP